MDHGQVSWYLRLYAVSILALLHLCTQLNGFPLNQLCEIKLQPNGSWYMKVPFHIQERLRTDPTSQLEVVVGIQSVARPIHGAIIHRNGQPEFTWPVLSAAIGHLIVAECQSNVTLELHGQQTYTEECFCADTSTTEPPANPSGDAARVASAELTTRAPLVVTTTGPPTTSEGGLPHYAIGLICFFALGVIGAGVCASIYIFRERIAAFFNELRARCSSTASSTDTIDPEEAKELSPNNQL